MFSYQLFDNVIVLIIQIYICKDSFSFFPLLKMINIILLVNQLASNQSAFNRLNTGCI
jgi:hypothetical protein